MENEINIDVWFQQLADAEKRANKDTPHIVVGYGSLMSKTSRDRYSNIRSLPLPVIVNGWERAWVTKSDDEKQTYVGAYQNSSSSFNGHAFYTNIDEKLLQRELDYRFSEVTLDQLDFGLALNSSVLEVLSHHTIYVCETLQQKLPSIEFPVNASYIDTCLKGCLEVGGLDEVTRFIKTTRHWPDAFKLDDRLKPKYPRAATICVSDCQIFDEIQKRNIL
ncbi:MAG: hypothetical protein ACJAWT_000355 [Glaciecola sp.]|jgi:hypothetical protein